MTYAGELSPEQRLSLLEARVNELERVTSGALAGSDGVAMGELPYSWPCGDITRRQLAPWWSAVNYCEKYNGGQYHTGEDFNLSDFADSGARVVACADGEIVFAGVVNGWQGWVVVVKHPDGLYSRYAHITNVTPTGAIKRGELIGYIADYAPKGPSGDHLHFDIAKIDLGAKPGDWPGSDQARVLRDYIDPLAWIKAHLP